MLSPTRTLLQKSSAVKLSHANAHGVLKSKKSEISSKSFCDALSNSTKLESVDRIKQLKFRKKLNLKKKAAVLVSLCSKDSVPSLLYTVRSQDLRKHSGQVSFPGGQCDWTDRDVIHTALREAEEEIGIPQSSVDIWEILPGVRDRTGTTCIYPVVGNLGSISVEELVPNSTEVSKIFTVPLEVLCNPKNRGYTTFRSSPPAPTYKLPLFLTEARIWGLTAIVTEILLFSMFPNVECYLKDWGELYID